MHKICAVVLAAGKGSRFVSERPKVLHTLLGDSMLSLVLHTVSSCQEISELAVVVGYKAEQVGSELARLRKQAAWLGETGLEILEVNQTEQLGTGHAVSCALPLLTAGKVLIVNGDMPLLSPELLREFLRRAEPFELAFMSHTLDDAASFGRIVRAEDGRLESIVEIQDLDRSNPKHQTREINTGLYLADRALLAELLPRLGNQNANGEYYLTDLIQLGLSQGRKVEALDAEQLLPGQSQSLSGINTPAELTVAEQDLRRRQVEKLLRGGVILHDPQNILFSPTCSVAAGAEISGPCRIFGRSELGVCQVEPFCLIQGAQIADGAEIKSFSHLDQARIGRSCQVGPYARLRPQAELLEKSKVGNFVEVKKSVLGKGSKASHLTYLGDATIGENVNIGAGTITCNYDGKNKFPTVIGDGSFIGSNTALVAPVSLGKNTLIGAGSVITKDVPDDHLAVTRAKQTVFRRHSAKKDED